MISDRNRIILQILFLAALTAAAFWSTLDNGFVNWDDQIYVTENPLIREFSRANLVEILSTFYRDDYRLLTVLLSFMAEYRLAGLDPFVYHLDNLLLHIATTCFVYWLLLRLGAGRVAAFVAALLFGVHPVHVEAVAWVAERKGVLSGFFFTGGLVAYMYYRDKGSKALYALTLALALLAMLSKLVAVSFPVALFVLDYLEGRGWLSRKNIVEKVPFMILSAAFAADTLFIYESTDQLASMDDISPWMIFLLVCGNLTNYLVNMALPVKLSAIYPFPEKISILEPWLAFSVGAVAVCAAAVAWSARRTRKVVFGTLFYLVTLLPVLQVVPFASGGSAIADRYLYVPSIGLFYLVGVGFRSLWTSRGRAARYALAGVLASAVAALAVLTYQRGDVWQTSESLYRDTVAKSPRASAAHFNLANIYMGQGRMEDAERHYLEAVRHDPTDYGGHYNLGLVYSKTDRPELAAGEFAAAARINPGEPNAYFNLGNSLARLDRLDEAVAAYRSALAIDPDRADIHNNLGVVYARMGDRANAAGAFTRALALDPDYTDARRNLYRVYGR